MLECRTQGDAHVVKVTVPQLNSTVASTFRTEVLAAVKDGAGPVVLSLDAVGVMLVFALIDKIANVLTGGFGHLLGI